MKCVECVDYVECSKKQNLTIKRKRCPMAKVERVKTNADIFRAMSDEEQQKCVRRFWEIEDFADWLKQPAEE